jgi:hypothetical protein
MKARIAVRTLAAAAAAAAAFAAPAAAQRAHRFEVAPAAGYLVPGDIARGPLGTALRAAAAPMFGGTAALQLAGPASLYAGAAYSDSDLEVGVPIVGGIALTRTRMLVLDGGLQLRGSGASGPLVQLGIGSMRYRFATGLVDVTADNAVATAAIGYDLALAPGFGLRLMAKDWVGRFDSSDAIFIDAPGRTAHNLALTAGLRFAF